MHSLRIRVQEIAKPRLREVSHRSLTQGIPRGDPISSSSSISFGFRQEQAPIMGAGAVQS